MTSAGLAWWRDRLPTSPSRASVTLVVAGLLPTRGDKGSDRQAPAPGGELLDRALGIGSVEEVVVKVAAVGAERILVARLLAEVEGAAKGVVKKDAIGGSAPQCEKERDAFVEGVGAVVPAVGVGVPHGEGLVTMVDGPGLVTEAEVVLVPGHRLPDAEGGAIERSGKGVFADGVARGVEEADAQRRFLHLHAQRCRRELEVGSDRKSTCLNSSHI